MIRNQPGMTSFLDLALIMVGATALVAQINLENTQSASAAGNHETITHFRYTTDEIFAGDEARLSDNGQTIIANLVPQMRGAKIRVHVPLYNIASNSRLNQWELASARTAAIFYTLHKQGVSQDRLEAAAIRVSEATGLGDQKVDKISIQRITSRQPDKEK